MPTGPRTSDTDPIRVCWLESQGTPGKVGLTFAPGKHGGSQSGRPWARDLGQDLDRLRQHFSTDVLVCLLEDDELSRLRIPNLVEEARARGVEVHRLPIPDGGVPPNTESVEQIVATIAARAAAGKNVVVHCMGGLGRAGTIGGCYLRACGVGGEQALTMLVEARQDRNCPETEDQRAFIRRFR